MMIQPLIDGGGGRARMDIDPGELVVGGGIAAVFVAALKFIAGIRLTRGDVRTSPATDLWAAMDRLRADLTAQIASRDATILSQAQRIDNQATRLEHQSEKIDRLEDEKRRLQTEVTLLNHTVARLVVFVPEDQRKNFNIAMMEDIETGHDEMGDYPKP